MNTVGSYSRARRELLWPVLERFPTFITGCSFMLELYMYMLYCMSSLCCLPLYYWLTAKMQQKNALLLYVTKCNDSSIGTPCSSTLLTLLINRW